MTLAFDTDSNPGTTWTSCAVPISEGGGHVGTLDGTLAPGEEIQTVLAELTALRIRGEYRTGADTGYLDNCILEGDSASRLADMNCDESIDFNDIDPLVTALISRDDYESQFPGCNWLNGDINQDNSVDFDDIDGFVDCLINGGCP